MHYFFALITLGFFGWLSFAVGFGQLPDIAGGSSKTRVVMAAADKLTETAGPAGAAAIVLALGMALAIMFLRRLDA